jgi:hypothetical protein
MKLIYDHPLSRLESVCNNTRDWFDLRAGPILIGAHASTGVGFGSSNTFAGVTVSNA